MPGRSRDYNPVECTVYIGDLGSSPDEREIEDAFSRFGPIRKVWIPRIEGRFAFVEFEDPLDAEDSVKEMDGRRVCGRRVRVEMARGGRREGGRRPRDIQCYECGETGHIARDCRRGRSRRDYGRSRSRSRDRY